MSFIESARLCGVKPDIMRRWLDRSEVRRFLLAERRAYRDAICAGNELALARVRDKSENGMAVIQSVRTLEHLNDADLPSGLSAAKTPGFVVWIANAQPTPRAEGGVMIDVAPLPEPDAPADE
jgi:hypothetical protein